MSSPYSTHVIGMSQDAKTLLSVKGQLPAWLNKITPVQETLDLVVSPSQRRLVDCLYWYLDWGDHGDLSPDISCLVETLDEIKENVEHPTELNIFYGATCIYDDNNGDSKHTEYWGDPWALCIEDEHRVTFPTSEENHAPHSLPGCR